jgi:undecaprenyl-diphosphatase
MNCGAEPSMFGPRLLPVLLIACGFAALTGLTFAVGDPPVDAVDLKVLLLFRHPSDLLYPLGPSWLESSVRDLTNLGGPALISLVTACACALFLVAGRRGYALWLLSAVLGAFLISSGMKLWLARPGPAFLPHAVPTDPVAFPSGHATSAAATYLTVGVLAARDQARRRVRVLIWTLAGLLTLAIGLSRVYLGTHWPTDVLAGWILGTTWALLCWLVATRMERGT